MTYVGLGCPHHNTTDNRFYILHPSRTCRSRVGPHAAFIPKCKSVTLCPPPAAIFLTSLRAPFCGEFYSPLRCAFFTRGMSGLSLFMRKLQKLDAYPKLKEDYREKTLSGATISIIAGIFMFILFASEFAAYLDLDTQHELVVDTGRGGHLRINMNITFRQMPCNVLSLDAMDISGRLRSDAFCFWN